LSGEIPALSACTPREKANKTTASDFFSEAVVGCGIGMNGPKKTDLLVLCDGDLGRIDQ